MLLSRHEPIVRKCPVSVKEDIPRLPKLVAFVLKGVIREPINIQLLSAPSG
jgi:hypothetical protein